MLDNPTATLQQLTDAVPLGSHDRTMLNRMMYWKLKGFWPHFFGARPGRPECQVPVRTQNLFTEPHIPGLSTASTLRLV